jgi:predicted transcriptional regulator
MYRANLSHQQLVKYLDLLLTHQLLTKQEELYETTLQGKAFINTYREIQVIMGETSTTNQSLELAS